MLPALFVLRVAGQALVAFFDVRFLPPMQAWYSRLMPYPYLLPSQRALGLPVLAFGYLYLAAMLARAVLVWDRPIPIVFHWVLAAFVITLGHSHRRRLA